MRLAVLSDIHGNLPALEAVLADARAAGVDQLVNLGDIVSGPLWPRETAERLMALNLPTLAGNHERQLLAPGNAAMGASDAWAAARLTAAQAGWLASLPATLALAPQVLMCHGTPTSDRHYLMETVVPGFAPTPVGLPAAAGTGPGVDAPPAHRGLRPATPAELARRLGDALQGMPRALVLCGHSHVPRAMQLADGRLVVNPGSVGLQAFDDEHAHPHFVENHSPHARYAVLTLRPAGWQVELRAVPHDHEAAARQAEAHGRPDWADALRTGRVGRREADLC